MPAVAFCGLGQMGAPMAARFLDADGVQLTVWNRSRARADGLAERGAEVAGTPAEAAAGADVVVTMLSTPGAVEAVVLGDHGVAAGLDGRAATVVEMSTIGPAAVARLRDALAESIDLLDAPVLGSVRQATEGTLKVFAGGDEHVYERVRPLLERLGTPRHVGPQGSGAAMKLVTNLCLGVLMSGLGEALALGRSLGLDQDDLLDVLVESPIGVTARSKRANIESGEYRPNFKLSLAAKDLGLVADRAADVGLDLPVTAAARRWLDAADAAGLGEEDYSAVIKQILGRS